MKSLNIILGTALAISTAGCASMPFSGSKTEIIRATKANPVMEVMTLWEPGEGRGLDDLPSRGFAGQLLFFTYQHPSPALVEGDVTVYVFDDVGSNADQSRPLWQRTFTSEEWNSFALQTNLGTAYQLFVPYVRKGQHEAHCSIRIKLEQTDGAPPVYSKIANVTIPGDKTELPPTKITRQRIEPKRLDSGAQQTARALGNDESAAASVSKMRTTSVALPRRHGASSHVAARLQQVAHEMVSDQQSRSDVEHASYFTETPDDDVADDPDSADARRYQLYR